MRNIFACIYLQLPAWRVTFVVDLVQQDAVYSLHRLWFAINLILTALSAYKSKHNHNKLLSFLNN